MKSAAFAAMGALALVAASVVAETKPRPKESPADQVMCVVCGDYTFERRHATPAVYEGKRIHLCSVNELALIEKTPDKYVWSTDVVTGKRVNKIHTAFSADRRVRVHKVKEKRFEVWPRRFFFESAKSRDEFLRNPARYLREPYAV